VNRDICCLPSRVFSSFPPSLQNSAENERLLRERRPNSGNSDELLQLMDRTRSARRLWILSESPTITAILQRYPRLQDMNKAVCEFVFDVQNLATVFG